MNGAIPLQIEGLLRVSRTVPWLREAARMDSTHLRRIAEEIGLTAIFLNTFACWILDTSEQQAKTREFLDRRLARAERLSAALFGGDTADSEAGVNAARKPARN